METQTLGSIINKSQRDAALDGLRTLAVLLMIASHTTRLILWDSRRDWSRFSLLIEPLTASLFLMLVGGSLAYSWHGMQSGKHKKWFKKQSLRAGGLWALSCLFYILDDGFHWPDAIFLSGILATIAYTILILMVLVSLKNAISMLLLLCLILSGLHVYLDHNQFQWFFVNAGNSPLIPLFLFACLGALGILALKSERPWIRPALVSGAMLTLIFILQKYAFAEVFSKPLGRYETIRHLLTGTGDLKIDKTVTYYNLRPILVPVISSLVILIYAVLKLLNPIINPISRSLFRMGRYSLDVYILHLSLLAIPILIWGLRPIKITWQGDALLLGLILICYFWSWIRERTR